MKKHILIYIILFISFITNAQTDNKKLRIVYELTYQIDSTDNKNLRVERMLLSIDNYVSSYQSERIYLKDSILKSNNPQALFSISKSKFRYKIYKNRAINKLNTLHNYSVYKFEVEEKIPNLKWNIGTEEKEILNLNCIKATTSFAGRDYIAWFANEIPISDGPYKFTGLPGLIMEISDTKNHYTHKAVGVSYHNNKININNNNNSYKKINKTEFNDFLKKIKEKPSLIFISSKLVLPKAGLDKYDRNHRARQKHENNPIELDNK